MVRFADIGAAVIGTGFIGTVHVEALRRIGEPDHQAPVLCWVRAMEERA